VRHRDVAGQPAAAGADLAADDGAEGPKQRGKAAFTVSVNGTGAAEGRITEDNADVLQPFDLTGQVRPGPDEVTVEVKGETGLMYQVVGGHFEP
jgi:hypothetical protein